MKKPFLIFLVLVALICFESLEAINIGSKLPLDIKSQQDSTRLIELDLYWTKIAKAVKNGDFKGFKKLYHRDAIVVFTYGENEVSKSIADVLIGWKKGFNDTKEGKQNDEVEFRFSQRVGNETTAHETGIFIFTSKNRNGDIKTKFIMHFEALLLKKNKRWLTLMEYQKSKATQEEWDALKDS